MLTLPLRLALYSFGQCHKQLNKRFDNAPLDVAISKSAFIETLLSGGLKKKERAWYKNLELLEKKKLISYSDKELRFTEKGYKAFLTIKKYKWLHFYYSAMDEKIQQLCGHNRIIVKIFQEVT